MKLKSNLFFILFIEIAFMFLMIETIFRVLTFPVLFNEGFIRIELFTLSSALFLAWLFSLLPERAAKLLTCIIGLLFGAYAVTQLQFMNYYGSYMSVRATIDGAGRVGGFAGEFINMIKPVYYLEFAAPVLVCILNILFTFDNTKRKYRFLITLAGCLLLEGIAYFNIRNSEYRNLYTHPRFIDRSIREFGLGRFLILDTISLATASSASSELLLPETTAEPKSEPEATASATATEEPLADIPSRRDNIDDSSWQTIMEQETDETRKTIDAYLMNRRITDYNDYTGYLKDYNVVYIMIEAFDYMAIDPVLTPTLYKMKEEGWDFTHHYTPKFSCATGESEFVSEISLVPLSDVCTPNQYAGNTWNNSIFNVFEHAGYYASAYHNWKDEFYERRTLYAHSGCEAYLNFDDLDYNQLWGWQSDLEMMELTIPYWIDKDKFFSLYVTSSTHFPYDQDSELGSRYMSEINEVHPDYPIEVKRYLSKSIELDKSLEYLISELESAGKMDNTLIVLFADHHPLETAIKTLADYGGQEADRLDGLNEDRTPLIFYSPVMNGEKFDQVNSTFDILPTVLNLVGIEYEPRIYVGSDIFDPESKLVIFPNGSWITENGSYYASDDTHDDTLSEEEVIQRNNEVTNLFSISRMIYNSDYFAYRETIPFPAER